MPKVRVVVCRVGEDPVVEEVEQLDLPTMQGFVGGLIEGIRVSSTVTLWCNEEGRLLGLEPNRWVGPPCYSLRGDFALIRGDFFLAGETEEGEGEDETLAQEGFGELEALAWATKALDWRAA